MIEINKKLQETHFFSENDLNSLLNVQKLRKKKDNVGVIKVPNKKTNAFEKLATTRNFGGGKVDIDEILRIIYECFRIKNDKNTHNYSLGHRTFPTAGGLNSSELYVYVRSDNILFKYNPYSNTMSIISNRFNIKKLIPYPGNIKLENISALFLFTLDLRPLDVKYGVRGLKYGLLEIGHSAQNVCIQATKHKLGYCSIGFFDDSYFIKIVKENYITLQYLIAIGQ